MPSVGATWRRLFTATRVPDEVADSSAQNGLPRGPTRPGKLDARRIATRLAELRAQSLDDASGDELDQAVGNLVESDRELRTIRGDHDVSTRTGQQA